jgi:hypothetical protein
MVDELTYRGGVVLEDGTQDLTAADKSFTYCVLAVPGKATNPSPANGATGVARSGTSLNWTAGLGGECSGLPESFDVYFGTASPGTYIRNQIDTSYPIPGTMAQGKVYYWRIDERNDAGIITGDVWSFRVEECLKSTASEYADWVLWGRPSCWCYARQCRGDINGVKTGQWVSLADFTAFKQAYLKTDAQLQLIPNGICADLNHTKTGQRVSLADFTTFKLYYLKPDAQVPCCDLNGDCILTAADKYLFWTN